MSFLGADISCLDHVPDDAGDNEGDEDEGDFDPEGGVVPGGEVDDEDYDSDEDHGDDGGGGNILPGA